MASKREPDTASNVPSAKFLQARITALSTTCIKRLENIFAAALDDDHSTFQAPPNSNAEVKPPPTLAETAVKQLQLDVESTALIRAVEEFMVLTRTLKELWLFGNLDTIPQASEQDLDMTKQLEANEELVVQAFSTLMAKADNAGSSGMNEIHDDSADSG